SSRRRHTRFSRDWSSDVCSSDLSRASTSGAAGSRGGALTRGGSQEAPEGGAAAALAAGGETGDDAVARGDGVAGDLGDAAVGDEIGRASCREGVLAADVGVAFCE